MSRQALSTRLRAFPWWAIVLAVLLARRPRSDWDWWFWSGIAAIAITLGIYAWGLLAMRRKPPA